MPGFEPTSSGVGRDGSANSATTTALNNDFALPFEMIKDNSTFHFYTYGYLNRSQRLGLYGSL